MSELLSHIKRLGSESVFLAFCAILLFGTPCVAEEQAAEEARNNYEKGMQYFRDTDWPSAVRYFQRSFDAIENSTTAYMLSVSYMQWLRPEKSLEYAYSSESLPPSLTPSLRTEVQKIRQWAEDYLAYNRNFNASGKADGFFAEGAADMAGPPRIPQTEIPSGPLQPIEGKAGAILNKRKLNGVYTIQQKSTSRYVDAHEYSGKDFSLVTRTKQNNPTQIWNFKELAPGVYTIQQMSNNRYVDAHESANEDYTLVTRPYQNNATQRWIVRPLGKHYYTIQQKSSGRYMDAHESEAQDFRIVTRSKQGNDTQIWKIARP